MVVCVAVACIITVSIGLVYFFWLILLVFTTRRYASTTYAVIVSVCLSHTCIVSKWLNLGPCRQCHTIAYGL